LYKKYIFKDDDITHCMHMLSLPQIWAETAPLNRKKKKEKYKATFKEVSPLSHTVYSDTSYGMK